TANNLNQYTTIDAITPSYDADGNMTWDGRFSYAYDAENRLIAAYSNNVCVVSNAYDHANRRVLKWTPCHTTSFVYDGWNLVQETISTASGTTTNHYVWGRDLSGTMQGAGGVGGLLAVSLNGAWYFPLFDANGNITAYVNEQGVVVAEYVYDAYGATIAASGSMSDTFRHRFSTKYYDAETDLYYYGYRFYSPTLHRWLNRDPIEEEGGFNLYAFCGNDGVNLVDVLGRRIWVVDGDMGYGDLVKSWNETIDSERKRIRTFIDALPTDSNYKFYWYYRSSPSGTWNQDKDISRQEFIRRMDSETVEHVRSQFISLSSDKRLVQATVVGHSCQWDATGYGHHTSELNEVHYRNESVPRETVKKAIDTIKPGTGYLVYSSCIGAGGVGKGWIETQQLAVSLYKPVANPKKCHVIWYAAYLKNKEVKTNEQNDN
ncbi:MAG: RHS repeat-associated core domain-containing protein, partial [Kiritimatiellia bacterium]